MKRTTRRRLTHLAMYAVLLAAAVVVALVLDWGRLQANFFSLDGLGDNLTALILVLLPKLPMVSVGVIRDVTCC